MSDAGDRTSVDRRSGESDMVTFERENVPEPSFRIEQVGSDPEITYRYDWDERGEPTPEEFERLGHLEVKLVTMMTDLTDEVDEEAQAAHEALVELKRAMMDCRDLDEEQRQGLAMGNLSALPEVSKRE